MQKEEDLSSSKDRMHLIEGIAVRVYQLEGLMLDNASLVSQPTARTGKEAQQEVGKTQTSYGAQLQLLSNQNADLEAAQRKAVEELQVCQRRWQEEQPSLLASLDQVNVALTEKQQQWMEREGGMGARMEEMEMRKKKGWFRRLFTCSGPR